METKRIERIEYSTMYVAADGTEFWDKDECAKYEKSFGMAMRLRIQKMAIKNGTECDMLNTGSDEATMYVVVPKSADDILHIQQFVIGCENRVSAAERVTEDLIGRVVLLTAGYDDSWAYAEPLDVLVSRLTDGKYKVEKVDSE